MHYTIMLPSVGRPQIKQWPLVYDGVAVILTEIDRLCCPALEGTCCEQGVQLDHTHKSPRYLSVNLQDETFGCYFIASSLYLRKMFLVKQFAL